MEADKKDNDVNMVAHHATQLSEHFDSVQIFCTKSSEDGTGNTQNISCGRGNCFAAYGQVRHWLIERDQGIRDDLKDGES